MKVLPIAFSTHNRTKCACYCLRALLRNLKFDGGRHVYICDDRSEDGHVRALEGVMADAGFSDYSVVDCSDSHWGYGYVLNKALEDAYGYSDVALRMEDDRLLEDELDATPLVDVLEEGRGKYAGVRLASRGSRRKIRLAPVDGLPAGLARLYAPRGGMHPKGHTFVYNFQCMLQHKAMFEKVRLLENSAEMDMLEVDASDRYNRLTRYGNLDRLQMLYYSKDGKRPPFRHIGDSTLGHRYKAPPEYRFLAD